MYLVTRLLAATVLLAGLFFPSRATHAGESYDNCTGFVDSVPATIATQGVWCVRHDLSTAITSGAAITVAANNVTIDCNDFKLGGLAAGVTSTAFGIFADGRQNVTVRHCNVRGFDYGIQLITGAGYVVEDNLLNQSLSAGLLVGDDNVVIQRNRVYDTGGKPASDLTAGIVAKGNVMDNTVSGVFATATNATVYGIYNDSKALIRGNHVSGLSQPAAGIIVGILATGAASRISDNHVAQVSASTGNGIWANGPNSFCTGNSVANYSTPYVSCEASAGNLQLP